MYVYTTKNNENKSIAYTDKFLNLCDAVNWYNNTGVWLEKKFKRELKLESSKSYQTLFFRLYGCSMPVHEPHEPIKLTNYIRKKIEQNNKK